MIASFSINLILKCILYTVYSFHIYYSHSSIPTFFCYKSHIKNIWLLYPSRLNFARISPLFKSLKFNLFKIKEREYFPKIQTADTVSVEEKYQLTVTKSKSFSWMNLVTGTFCGQTKTIASLKSFRKHSARIYSPILNNFKIPSAAFLSLKFTFIYFSVFPKFLPVVVALPMN